MHPLVALYAKQSENYAQGAKDASDERGKIKDDLTRSAAGAAASAVQGADKEGIDGALDKLRSRRKK